MDFVRMKLTKGLQPSKERLLKQMAGSQQELKALWHFNLLLSPCSTTALKPTPFNYSGCPKQQQNTSRATLKLFSTRTVLFDLTTP